jgi:hypothetical protein
MEDAWILRALAFVHPAWMVGTIALALATARLGLAIRRRRAAGEPPGAELRGRHLRLGRVTLYCVAIGFVLGPLSMYGLRGQAVFDSFHGILGLAVAFLFAWTGWSGRALSRGDKEARVVHRFAASSAIALSMLSAVVGFVLLP